LGWTRAFSRPLLSTDTSGEECFFRIDECLQKLAQTSIIGSGMNIVETEGDKDVHHSGKGWCRRCIPMSGHSKWSTIKRKKGAADARRGQLFTKLIREIVVAVRESGEDPETNFRLRLAIDRAKRENMPNENIERAIDRAMGRTGEAEIVEVIYEGYAPNGVALIIDTATDNRNRTVAEVRNVLNKGGGSLGETGCVSWLFDVKGYIALDVPGEAPEEYEEKGEEIALMAMDVEGVEDVLIEGETVEVYTDLRDLGRVRDSLAEMGFEVSSAEKTYKPKSMISLDVKDSLQIMKLVERIEDLDDVQRTFSNLEISDEVLVAYEE
jgi:YebC/PmpR family DNA-binding regulatory protein